MTLAELVMVWEVNGKAQAGRFGLVIPLSIAVMLHTVIDIV